MCEPRKVSAIVSARHLLGGRRVSTDVSYYEIGDKPSSMGFFLPGGLTLTTSGVNSTSRKVLMCVAVDTKVSVRIVL